MELWNHSTVAELLAPITSFPGPGAFLPGVDRAGKEQARARGTPLHLHAGGTASLLSAHSSKNRHINYRQLKYSALVGENLL